MSLEANPLSGVGYVNLGLFSQALLKELFQVEDSEGSRLKNPRVLPVAIASLKFLEGHSVENPSDVALKSYEENMTLLKLLEGKAAGLTTISSVEHLLEKIASSGTKKQDRLGCATKAIAFFMEVSKRAVVNTRFPEDEMPVGVKAFAGS